MNIQSMLPKANRRTLNSYDMWYNSVVNKPLFNQEDWINSANNGTLDIYVQSLLNSGNINIDDYMNKYNLSYADSKTRLAALYNETGANRYNTDTEREIPVQDKDGTVWTRTDKMSDYEYNLSLIRKQTDFNQEQLFKSIQNDMKDSATLWDHLASIAIGAHTAPVEGFLTGGDNIAALIASTGQALGALIEDPSTTADVFVENLASDDWRPMKPLVDGLVDFETKYSTLRDADGNYISYGKYLGGALTSLGEMLPSMLIGYAAGGYAGAAGAAAGTASKIASGVSQGLFYGGMAAGNVQDMYVQFEANGADVDSASILANAAIKSTLQWGVERLLGKVFGATSLDNMVFGTAQKTVTAKTLTGAGIKSAIGDVVQEGLEEVLQDTSDFLVDRAFGLFIEEYKNVSSISWQSLVDAFLIGGLMSFGGAARNILTADTVIDSNGKKLNKIAAWQYGLSMESFADSLNMIQKFSTHFYGDDATFVKRELSDKDRRRIIAATTEAYASYRMITSVYKEIGEERFKSANDVLNKITKDIKAGKFDAQTSFDYAQKLKDQIGQIALSNIEKIVDELRGKGVSEVKYTVESTEKPTKKSTEKSADKAKELADELNANNAIVTDGSALEVIDGSVIVGENRLNTESINELLKHTAIRKLSDSLNEYLVKFNMHEIMKDAYKAYSGLDSFDDRTLSCALLFDKSFFTSTLLTGNKDVYKLLSYFVQLTKDVKVGRAYDTIYKKTISDAIDNWCLALADYCSIHPEAQPDMFLFAVDDKKKRIEIENRIKRYRVSNYLYQKVMDSKKGLDALTDDERNWIENTVRKLFKVEVADRLLSMLNDNDASNRNSAMHTIYKNGLKLFEGDYDDIYRLRDISIGNRVFNNYLDRLGKNVRVDNFLSESTLNQADKKRILDDYGKITQETIIDYRQSQFKDFTNNFYNFKLNGKEIEIVSKETYLGGTNLIRGIKNISLDDRTGISSVRSRGILDKKMLSDEFKHLYRYFTLDDIVNNPNILNNDTRNDILRFVKEKYSVDSTNVSPQMMILYLNNIISKNGLRSLAFDLNGNIVVVDLTLMKNMLTGVEITKTSSLEDIIKSNFLPKGLKLEILSDEEFDKRTGDNGYLAYFEAYKELNKQVTISNTIYVRESVYNQSQEDIQCVILHELQHAIQFENWLDGGGGSWYTHLSDKDKKDLLNDFAKFMPHLFNKYEKLGKVESFVNGYVYRASGELHAFGVASNSDIYDFVPFRILEIKDSVYALAPWGKKYKLNGVTLKNAVNLDIDNLTYYTEVPQIRQMDNNQIIDDSLIINQFDDDYEGITDYEHGLEWEKAYKKFEMIYNETLYNWVHGGVSKSEVLSAIDDEARNVSFEMFRVQYAHNIPMNELLEMDIPFMRYQYRDKLFEDDFVSIAAISGSESIAFHLEDSNLIERDVDDLYIILGTFKLKDAYFYIAEAESEVLIHPSKIVENSKIYSVKAMDDGIYFDNGKPVEYVTTGDMFSRKTRLISPLINETYDSEVREPHKNELRENDKRAKNFVSTERRPNAKYSDRYYVLNDDGTQKLDNQGKPIYHRVYDKSVDRTRGRYVGKRKYKGTNLEYFNKKYTPLQMTREMQTFVLEANGLDPILQERINGSEAGTLTERDVMDYFRSAEKMDDKTFKAINDAFFHNEYIKSFKELQDRIDTKLALSWAFYRLVKTNEKMKPYEKMLKSINADISFLVEAIENNKDTEIANYYGRLYSNFNQLYERTLDVKDEYARMTYMRLYNGTIESEWKIAANVRHVAIHNYNTTHKIALPVEVTTESYEEIMDDMPMNKGAMIEAIKMRELARKAKELAASGENYKDHIVELLQDSEELVEQLEQLSTTKIKQLYESEGGIGKILVEGTVAMNTGEYVPISNDVPKITSAAIINNIRGYLRTIRRNLSGKELSEFLKEHSDIFDKDLRLKKEVYQNVIINKTRKGVHYRNKPVEELDDLLEKITKLKDEVLDSKRYAKESLRIKDKRERDLQRRIRDLERENERLSKSKQKSPNFATEFIVENEVINIDTNVEIPDVIKTVLQTQYEKTAKTTVKNLTEDGELHVKMVSKSFYEKNAELLNSLTQGDVDNIVDFYLRAKVSFNDINAPYIATEVWMLTYLIKAGRKGNPMFVIDSDTLSKLESTLKNLQSTFGTGQVTWREALKELNPEVIIAQSMAYSCGLEVDEGDVESLLKAVNTRDMTKVETEKNRIYEKLLKEYRKKRADRKKLDKLLDKILQYERLAMLSGPGTWVRNWTSNQIIEGSNKLTDGMNGKLENLLYKLFPQTKKVKGQYKIAGTKVMSEVSEYIANNLLNNGLLDMVMEYLTKYDVRKSHKGEASEDVLTDMIAKSIVNQFHSEHLSDNKIAIKIEDFIRKMISDNKHVKKAAIRYLGKMITEDLENGRIKSKTEFLSKNHLDKNFLRYVAEAYKLATYDYMHKSNFIMQLESQIAKKSTGAYFMYKQIFPFAGASWNWFVEGLNYSPLGLAKAVINFAKLEKTVEKMDIARQTYANNDVGISSDFAKYLTIRNIGKGLIGSVGYVVGGLLVAFGVARIDEEDDKYKIVIADQVYIDISDLFGTQGIFLGMVTVGAIKNRDSAGDVFIAALDQLFLDSTFADVFNNFRYSQSFGDWLAYQPYSMLNMMIPNFIKTITSMTTPYSVKYSDGVQGKAEKLLANAIPGLSYAFPHYYDPYTGEKQVPYKFWALTKAVDKLTPFGLSVYNISDKEKLCIEYGINKSQLSGRYTVNEESVKLKSSEIEKLNRYYGQLNVSSFKELEAGRVSYKIQQKDGSYKKVRWQQMTDAEKAAIINRTMTNNSGYAKIYILTESGKYKYYASESEYRELRSLGIVKNVYKASGKNNGFVKIK